MNSTLPPPFIEDVDLGYLDDSPVFNWDVFQGEPARSWRHEPKLTIGEKAKLGAIGLGMVIVGFVFLVLAFCYFQ